MKTKDSWLKSSSKASIISQKNSLNIYKRKPKVESRAISRNRVRGKQNKILECLSLSRKSICYIIWTSIRTTKCLSWKKPNTIEAILFTRQTHRFWTLQRPIKTKTVQYRFKTAQSVIVSFSLRLENGLQCLKRPTKAFRRVCSKMKLEIGSIQS